jgi:tripartite-type tricarboxylate transporter receptor subunit TctC
MTKLLSAIALLVAAIAGANAQSFPSRVITLIVPLPPGGATDLLARTLAEHMRGTLGQTVIVESIAGAGGTLGGARLARAAPDGYTISIGNWATHVGAGAIYPIQYDVREFEPIAKVADTPLWIVTKNALPVKNLSEFVAWLKTTGDKATAGNVGPGSGGHLCGLYFQKITGTHFTFVPYKGGAPAMQDLVAGQTDFMCDMAANTLPQVRAGRIKAIAVMARSRWFAAPDVPTADEEGVSGIYISLWHGLWAPKGTPPDVIAKLNAAVVNALADADVRKRLAEQGQEIPPREQQTPEGLRAFHKAEIEKWWPIIKDANIKAQ